jgi:phosphate transport system substrate-binding protein
MVGQDSRHNTVVTLSRRGTVDGFDQLDARLADIGMASSEWANFPERKLDGSIETGLENVIALDAVVPMVNTMNSVASVTIDQLRRIYLCEIVNWSQVGGEAGEIMAYGRDPRSGTYQVWRDLVMRGQEPGPCVKATRDSDEMQKKIKETGHSIGYAGFAFTRGNKPLDIITDCGPQRLTFRPDEDLVRTEEYPLSRRLYLYALRPYENSDTRDFIKYAMSSEAWRIAANDGFISLEPKLYPKSDEDPRTELMRRGLAGYGPLTTIDDLEMVDYLNSPVSDSNAQRITITFRFRPGSSELDSKAESDVSRLVDFLRKPEYASRRLYIAGFADATLMTDPNTPNDVKEKINIDLSRSRARTIADKLRAQNIRINPSDVKGFGRIAPVACNDDWIRRDKNRRVEVWLL